MTITTLSIGSNDYTSYATVAQAVAFLAVDPVRGTKWAALAEDVQGKHLVAATRRLDLLKWLGAKTGGASQEAQWPRTGLTFKDGSAVSTTEVPKEVENATILLAGDIALSAKAAESKTADKNTKRVKAGSAEVEFFRPVAGTPLENEAAFKLIACFLEAGVSPSGVFAGGSTDTCFPTSPELTEGFS